MIKHTFRVAKCLFEELNDYADANEIKKKDAIGFALYLLIDDFIKEKRTIKEILEIMKKFEEYEVRNNFEYTKTSIYLDDEIVEIIYMLFAKLDGKVSKSQILNYAVFCLVSLDEEYDEKYFDEL